MKNTLLILAIFILGCSDPEVIPDCPEPEVTQEEEDKVWNPCDIDSEPPYFMEIVPDNIKVHSKGHIVYNYDCIPYHDSDNMRSASMVWKFDGCWAFNMVVDKCK